MKNNHGEWQIVSDMTNYRTNILNNLQKEQGLVITANGFGIEKENDYLLGMYIRPHLKTSQETNSKYHNFYVRKDSYIFNRILSKLKYSKDDLVKVYVKGSLCYKFIVEDFYLGKFKGALLGGEWLKDDKHKTITENSLVSILNKYYPPKENNNQEETFSDKILKLKSEHIDSYFTYYIPRLDLHCMNLSLGFILDGLVAYEYAEPTYDFKKEVYKKCSIQEVVNILYYFGE